MNRNYIYDYLGRKIVERNSAGISTLYVYDSLDRVVFTFFGCNVDSNSFGTVYNPYNFDDNSNAGEDGRGVAFDYHNDEFPYARYINLNTCEYYRKYKYDAMSNLTETYFFEYWGVNANNQVVQLDSPKIIKQTTEYDMLGRAVKSCQFDALVSNPEKRCIETKHDAFGNITKKTENGEERIITYDLRNRPLTVTVDGLQTEEYSYSNAAAGGYFGYDSIRNKYENILPLTTYKDKWGRAAKSVDPFGNNVEPHYNSTTWLTDYSKTYNGTALTGFDAYEYDDLGRISTVKKVLFDPASNTSNAAATSIDGIAAKEMVLEKSYSYDSDTGSVVAIEDSFGRETVNTYDHLNRIVKVENYDADNLLVSSERTAYDTTGRISAVQNWTSAKTTVTEYDYDRMGRVTATCVSTANVPETQDCLASSCTFTDTKCSYQLYNTGGQVIWSADTETGGITYLLPFLNADLIVGNETVYDYNAFGEAVKTARRMTANGKGGGYAETQLYNSDAWITTNFTYDPFGRITEKSDDNGAKTHYTYTVNNLPATEKYCGSDDPNCASPREVTYTYNTLRDLVSETYEQDNVSLTVNYGRDNYGRISQKYTGTTATDVYQTFTYNNRNLLETATDTVGNAAATSVTRYYDSFGNPYSETVSSGNVTKTVSRRMTDAKTYQFTYPDGKTLRKTATGNDLDSIEYGTTGNLSGLASYSRANGVLTAITKGQNLIETFSYNNWNLLDNHTISNANADVYDMSYNYSRGWHLIEKADGIKQTSDKYRYDSYYRLKEVKYDFANNTAARTDSFFADGVHNIEQSTENGTTFAWGVDKLNRLRNKKIGGNTAVTYKYDERNNMIGEDFDGSEPADISYIYDDLNRLIEVKDGSQNTTATYTYDAFNRRITKTVGNTTERYSYDDWNIVEISTNSNNYTNIIDSGMDRHIAIEVTANNTSTLYYFLTDERGNVTALTDANGNVLERYRYRVYGDFEILDAQFAPKDCSNQTCYATNLHNFLWGGSLYEPETNLYWMRNRYYHLDMHRFINQDPIGIWGDTNNLGNGFAYVAGMVIEASDPTGLESLWESIQSAPLPDGSFHLSEEVRGYIMEPYKDGKQMRFEAMGPLINGSTELYAAVVVGTMILEFLYKKYKQEPDFIDRLEEKFLKNAKSEEEKKRIKEDFKKIREAIENERKKEQNNNKEDSKENNEESSGEENSSDLNTYWVDPDSPEDKSQSYFANKFIKKILEMHEKKSFFEMMEEEGPIIKYDDNGRKVFIFNPFYRGKDPMKQTYWKTKNADGTNGFVRNPFAPGAEYGYDSTTYEKWQQSGFPQTNVDPYFE